MMRVMMLTVVVFPPRLVSLLDLRPGARVGERMVSEPSLNRDSVELGRPAGGAIPQNRDNAASR